jgi:hypothetical protein
MRYDEFSHLSGTQITVQSKSEYDEITSQLSDEVGLDFETKQDFTITKSNYSLDFIWKSNSFYRMQRALKTFAVDTSA